MTGSNNDVNEVVDVITSPLTAAVVTSFIRHLTVACRAGSELRCRGGGSSRCQFLAVILRVGARGEKTKSAVLLRNTQSRVTQGGHQSMGVECFHDRGEARSSFCCLGRVHLKGAQLCVLVCEGRAEYGLFHPK